MNNLDPDDPTTTQQPCTIPQQLHCALAAGDPGDLREIEQWCATLPTHCYGQIFIEAHSPKQIPPFHTPLHVNITWICPDEFDTTGKHNRGIIRGQALAHAVNAWLDEWIRADQGDWHYSLWMGANSSSIIRNYWKQVQAELDQLWSHKLHQ